jgi:peroxiredoxin
MKIVRVVVACLVLAGLVLAGCGADKADPGVNTATDTPHIAQPAKVAKIGQPAPIFQLTTPEGVSISLADYNGKPVLLNFWATWCTNCIQEMPYLEEVYAERPRDTLVMLAVDIGETPGKVQEFLQTNDIKIPIVMDPQKTAAMQYSIAALPTTILIDKDGIVRDIVIGAFPDKDTIDAKLKQIVP